VNEVILNRGLIFFLEIIDYRKCRNCSAYSFQANSSRHCDKINKQFADISGKTEGKLEGKIGELEQTVL